MINKFFQPVFMLFLVLGFGAGTILLPLNAMAGNNTVVDGVISQVQVEYQQTKIEMATYAKLMERLQEASAAPDDSDEYRAAIENFRIEISSEAGRTITVPSANKLFEMASQL